jgi:predicted nucleic acid-binding protein
MVYVDSGVLIKLYVREPNSPDAAAVVGALPAIPLTPLHELEIRNTLRALVGRGAITEGRRAASEHTFDIDIAAGRLRRTVPDWGIVFRRATELSAAHTPATLARPLDLLHVAAAGPTTNLFVTANGRQAEVARLAGLETRLID